VVILKKAFKFLFALPIAFSLAPHAAGAALPINDSMRLEDIVITLLMPEIQTAVNNFYFDYLNSPPTTLPYISSKIIEINGGAHIHEGVNNSHYEITVVVEPYIGAHVSVGSDKITLKTGASGNVSVVNFEHIKSYEIPAHLQWHIIKSLP
jgi:hypothetical protein